MTKYEAMRPDNKRYAEKRAYVYDKEGNQFVAVFHQSDAYPDPLAAAMSEAARLNKF